MNNKFKKFILLAGDIGVLYLSLYLTLFLRYFNTPVVKSWSSHFWPFTIAFVFWLIIFYISNLYNLNLAVNNRKFFQLTGRALIIAGLTSTAFFYLTPQITIAPKRNLVIYVIIFAILFFLWRQFFNWSLKSYLPKNNLAIIGYNDLAKDLIEDIEQKKHLGYCISFIVDNTLTPPSNLNNIKIVKEINELPDLILKNKISTIIFTANPHESTKLRSILFSCLPLKIDYIDIAKFYENFTGKVPVHSISQMWFLENLNEGSKTLFNLVKRFYDLIFSLLIFIVTLPFWLLAAIVIKLESQGPVFFIMPRAGRNNRLFNLIKFRTMKEEGNDRSPTKVHDPRITGFGKLLRRTRLDELPQVINIIRGEMSFVGPRPERPELVSELEKIIPFYHERLLVKPGLTGWDQVSGEYHSPSPEDSLKKLQYDLFYIKNRSIYLDLSIILKTVATVISRMGI